MRPWPSVSEAASRSGNRVTPALTTRIAPSTVSETRCASASTPRGRRIDNHPVELRGGVGHEALHAVGGQAAERIGPGRPAGTKASLSLIRTVATSRRSSPSAPGSGPPRWESRAEGAAWGRRESTSISRTRRRYESLSVSARLTATWLLPSPGEGDVTMRLLRCRSPWARSSVAAAPELLDKQRPRRFRPHESFYRRGVERAPPGRRFVLGWEPGAWPTRLSRARSQRGPRARGRRGRHPAGPARVRRAGRASRLRCLVPHPGLRGEALRRYVP